MKPSLKNPPTTLHIAISYYGPEFCADMLQVAVWCAGITWEKWLKDGGAQK